MFKPLVSGVLAAIMATWCAPEIRASEARRGAPDGPVAKRVNVSVKDADVRDVLTFLAREARSNLVMSPGVRGTVTLYLQDVSVTAAFASVVKVHGLDMSREGTVMIVMTRKEMLDYLAHRRWGSRR